MISFVARLKNVKVINTGIYIASCGKTDNVNASRELNALKS